MASTDWASNEWEHGSGFTEGLDDEIKGMDELKLSHRLTKVSLRLSVKRQRPVSWYLHY